MSPRMPLVPVPRNAVRVLRSLMVERVAGWVLRGEILPPRLALSPRLAPVRATVESPRGSTALVREGTAAGVRDEVATGSELRGVAVAVGVREVVGTPLEVVRAGA